MKKTPLFWVIVLPAFVVEIYFSLLVMLILLDNKDDFFLYFIFFVSSSEIINILGKY